MGKIEFSNKISLSGRARSANLVRLLGDFASDGGDVTDESEDLELDDGCLDELDYWRSLKEQPPFKIGAKKRRCTSTLASDASSSRYGFFVSGRHIGGSFTEDIRRRDIAEKESWALATLVKATLLEDCDHNYLVDNRACVGAFTKGRSKNAFINNLILEVNLTLDRLGSRATYTWISTSQMGPLADMPSRSTFIRDDYGLSEAGVAALLELEPSIDHRRASSDLISLFSGPANNPLDIDYCSLDYDFDDRHCRKQEAFECLEDLASRGRKIAGGVFCFPPTTLISALSSQIVRLGLAPDTQVYILVPTRLVLGLKNTLRGSGSLTVKKFCGSRNKSFFFRKSGHAFSLVVVCSFDLVEGWRRLKSGKRVLVAKSSDIK